MRKRLLNFIKKEPLNNSLLIGFYGGGNYGDELLLEILAGLLQKKGVRDVAIAYQHPALYENFHHEFGFPRIDMFNKSSLLKAIIGKKNIVVGGGGLWGMDANSNLLFLGMLLLFCRWVLGKNVHLLSVGYYNSAPRIGRLSAWFAAKAANTILARDEESYKNFKQLQTKTYRDTDIAWYIDELDLGPYEADLSRLEQQLKVSGKTLFITLRRFRDKQQDQLASIIHACISQNADKNIIVALMEPRHVDPAGYRLLRSWQRQFTKLQIVDCGLNPLAFFLFFRKYHDQLVFIGPQFHGILSAHLNDMPYLPLAYDNKVANLLKYIAPKTKPIGLESLRALDLQRFIDSTYGEQV